MADTASHIDFELEARTRTARRSARWILMLVAALTLVAALVPMRFVAQAWSNDDVFQCQASAFVGQAGSGARTVAMRECLAHRRSKRGGPWGVFGNANDRSKYTAPDD